MGFDSKVSDGKRAVLAATFRPTDGGSEQSTARPVSELIANLKLAAGMKP